MLFSKINHQSMIKTIREFFYRNWSSLLLINGCLGPTPTALAKEGSLIHASPSFLTESSINSEISFFEEPVFSKLANAKPSIIFEVPNSGAEFKLHEAVWKNDPVAVEALFSRRRRCSSKRWYWPNSIAYSRFPRGYKNYKFAN